MSGWDQGNSLAKASEAYLACMGNSCPVNDSEAYCVSSFDEEETMNCSVGGTDDAKRALYYIPNNAIVLFFHIRMENRPYSWRCKFEPPQLLGG